MADGAVVRMYNFINRSVYIDSVYIDVPTRDVSMGRKCRSTDTVVICVLRPCYSGNMCVTT